MRKGGKALFRVGGECHVTFGGLSNVKVLQSGLDSQMLEWSPG